MRWQAAGIIALVSATCLRNAEAETPPPPEWIVIEVGRVQVKPTKIDGSTWDGKTESNRDGECGAIAGIATVVTSPLGGAVASFLCYSSSTGQVERNVTAPDLLVELKSKSVSFRSPMDIDTFGTVLNYSFVVPTNAIPAAGLQLVVLDQDAQIGSGEFVGAVRLTKKQLMEIVASDSPLLELADSQVTRLEVTVTPHEAPTVGSQTVAHAVKRELTASRISVRAGELLTISANGWYQVTDKGEHISATGYATGRRNYNIDVPGFEALPHASAVALVGKRGVAYVPMPVGSCSRMVASIGGPVSVGTNDRDTSNNSGSVEFTATIGLPSEKEWLDAGSVTACPPTSSATPNESSSSASAAAQTDSTLSPDVVLTKLMSAYVTGLKSCYKDVLAGDPSAEGSVSLAMTVNSSGKTVATRVQGLTKGFEACVSKRMAGWRFPVPKDSLGNATSADFSLKLRFKPD